MQNWRALALLDTGEEALLILGASQFAVLSTYSTAFTEVLAPEVQERVVEITLERWRGRYDRGTWEEQGTLRIPKDGQPSGTVMESYSRHVRTIGTVRSRMAPRYRPTEY